MKPEMKLLVDALRGGKFVQGSGFLERILDGEHLYCCLGVACKVVDANFAILGTRYLPESMQRGLGMTRAGTFIKPIKFKGRIYGDLASLNDSGYANFNEIADIIEANLDNFKTP